MKRAKGFRFGRGSKERLAREALLHAGTHAFRDRRKKKRVMRAEWNIKINAGVRAHGFSYSKLIGALAKKKIRLDRKILATLAEYHPETFKRVLDQVTP